MSSNPGAVFLGSERGMIPLRVDPPDQVRYRYVRDPLFTPPKLTKLEAKVAVQVNRHIDPFIERASCDRAAELAAPHPLRDVLAVARPADRMTGRLHRDEGRPDPARGGR